MPALTSLALAGGALVGGLAGAAGKTETQSSSVNVGQQSALGALGEQGISQNYQALQGLVGSGPGQQDVANAYGAQKDLAAMFQQYSQNGGLPTGSDIQYANNAASNLMGAQRVGLQQSFIDQNTDANRQAALMGRDMNDPILRAKLATEQTRQTQMLNAQQGAVGQQLALQQPMQRLQMAQQHASILGGLATQAMQNRQALLSMGQQLQQNDQNWRLATASRTQTQQSGGGAYGAISGALGGLGMGMNLASGFQNFMRSPVNTQTVSGSTNPVGSAPSLGVDYSGIGGSAPASQMPGLGVNYNFSGAPTQQSFGLGINYGR